MRRRGLSRRHAARYAATPAYFRDAGADLDQAQHDKLERICRKLRLRPGERFLDIGCGWGALVLHAAREHGVHAVGITLSEEQARLACERVRGAVPQSRHHVERRRQSSGRPRRGGIDRFVYPNSELPPLHLAVINQPRRPRPAIAANAPLPASRPTPKARRTA